MNNKNYIIRKTETKDAEQFVKLRNLVWRSAYAHIFPEEVFIQMESEEKIARFKAGFAEHQLAPDRITYVAELNGKLIGFFVGVFLSDYGYFKEKKYADLQAIYIHPDYQHIGLGREFFNIFVNELRERNIKNFVIGVLKDNKQARNAYEKWGGKLKDYSQPFVKLGKEYTEVFYTYDVSKIKEKIL